MLEILFILHALPSILNWSSLENMQQIGKIWTKLKEKEKDRPFSPCVPYFPSLAIMLGQIPLLWRTISILSGTSSAEYHSHEVVEREIDMEKAAPPPFP